MDVTMKAVLIMYDSLNRRYLPPYGMKDIIAPNFARLAEHSITFDNFYCGSMPCMPARREIQTGRYNFLHRSWGPLEPFDDSCPEILSNSGICTQFVSDHAHYWQDGGLTYHQRFSAFEFIRGQEGDEWHARAAGFKTKRNPRRQDTINREYTRGTDCCHARCFEAARDFLVNNHNEDNWYLHLEYFDPHEPFDAPEKYKRLYTDEPIPYDWPVYGPVEDAKQVRDAIINYKACISMCDDYLGRILDIFDQYNLWKDTLLIVNTDHGYMLGEHGYMAKNYMPCYQELVNLPFFIYHPDFPECAGSHRSALSQSIDIAPTLLEYFGAEIPASMQGHSLIPVVKNDEKVHDYILYGYFGKHVNITDGRYMYFRCARDNSKLYEYTLMPTRLASLFKKEELRLTECLERDFRFSGNVPMLKIPANTEYVPNGTHHMYDVHLQYGDMLFDLENDPGQENNLIGKSKIEEQMILNLVALMKESEAPVEQYERLGLNDYI